MSRKQKESIEKKRSYSISLDARFKDEACSGFNGSLTKTFLFLNELMSECYGDLDKRKLNRVMKKYKGK